MAIGDIPTRDGDDGATQLAKLRSYLKDLDDQDYQYPDDLLISNLEVATKEVVWRALTGVIDTAIPWSYDASDPTSYVFTIRAITGDTNELALVNTDHELESYLEFLPMRFLLLSLKANVPVTTSYPLLRYHPLRIMRKLLDDTGGTTYTDTELLQKMFDECRDPYQVAVSIIEEEGSVVAAGTARDFSGDLATIDGISFKGTPESTSHSRTKADIDVIFDEQESSPYNRGEDYQWFIDGVANVARDGEWYGV